MNVLSRRGLPVAAVLAALVSAAAAPAASADTVNIRIEGESRTLASNAALSVPATGTFDVEGQPCNWDSLAGAIELVTAGNWDRKRFASEIAGESHTYTQKDWWHLWQNRKPIGQGACDTPIADGDELLVFAQRDDAQGNQTLTPLILTAPPVVGAGRPVEVTVTDLSLSAGYPPVVTPRPAAGVTITGGGQTATTNAEGKATITFQQAGAAELQATGASKVRSNVASISVTPPGKPPAVTGTGTGTGTGAGTPAGPGLPAAKDTLLPKSAITGITAKRFTAAKAPKLLRGSVDDAGGVSAVKLRLTRTNGKRCEAWSAKRERFIRRPKCGAASGWWWSVGDKAQWEYQLPSKLAKGRYVLDVKAIDRSGNSDVERRPGENRVVFVVR